MLMIVWNRTELGAQRPVRVAVCSEALDRVVAGDILFANFSESTEQVGVPCVCKAYRLVASAYQLRPSTYMHNKLLRELNGLTIYCCGQDYSISMQHIIVTTVALNHHEVYFCLICSFVVSSCCHICRPLNSNIYGELLSFRQHFY